jgi:hypothetical protein
LWLEGKSCSKILTDSLLCGREEVQGVSVRISLPLILEALNLKDMCLINIKEFAAAPEYAQCGLVEDLDDLVFFWLCLLVVSIMTFRILYFAKDLSVV